MSEGDAAGTDGTDGADAPVTRRPAAARVVLDSPLPQLDHLFDYSIPDELRDLAVPGVRVTVPLRSAGRIARGYIVEVVEAADGFDGVLSPLDSVVSAVPVLSPAVWTLARTASDRAAGGASDILRLAIPARQVRVEKIWQREQDEPRNETPLAPAPALEGYGPELERLLTDHARVALDVIPRVDRLASGTWVGRWAITLAQAAARVVSAGESAILAVPDYRDSDQLLAALADLLPVERITRVDANQPNAERYRGFLDCLTDTPRVILGNRSAVYAPASRLGLLALWDDGDPLHSEPLAPYVHARDAALIRQEQSGAALIFAGHTRSADVQRLVEVGWLNPIAPERASSPRVLVTARADHEEAGAVAARIPSMAWRQAKEALASGPVLVQVARPGYAPVLACGTCSSAARCTSCGGPLGIARAGAAPACTLCGAIAANWVCPTCEGTKLRLVTRGTGRTAEELGRAFPGVPVIVSDGERQVTTVEARPALVVATRGAEPVAAGGYAAVLLLDGDRMLAAEHLRIGEDCLRWWSNAAALARPGAPVVLTGVTGDLARALATWTQPAFASAELADRHSLRFPPAVRAASVSGDPSAVADALDEVRDLPGANILGPTATDDGVRAILRLDYGQARDAAKLLRGAVVKNAARRRKAPPGKAGYRPPPTLRVRFDDPEILS
ncbi:primosomal protein N' (replication factor Y) [Mycetocola sp. CAN_C7]|uniref:primosomal protein N' family DNA-binding protein n=1 Tax=Mycetocola sp. CAN_C7 TaxID=2787724 RepID=UPI0018C8E6F1